MSPQQEIWETSKGRVVVGQPPRRLALLSMKLAGMDGDAAAADLALDIGVSHQVVIPRGVVCRARL